MTMIVSEKRFYEVWNNDTRPGGMLYFVDLRYRLLGACKFLSRLTSASRAVYLDSLKGDFDVLERMLCLK